MSAAGRCLLGLAALLLAAAARAGEPAPPVLDRPLLAAWGFDEPLAAARDSSGRGYHAAPERPDAAGIARSEGVFGTALELSGTHKLRVSGGPAFDKVARLALSAWVRPVEFQQYNEIFRKDDGDQRVLFSFQEQGTILSLGLNVAGYAECDAAVDPAVLLDGQWHHCAATFDGQAMRVYLDGREIGRLDRPGTILAGGPTDGCLGSSSGGECFQGSIDDLRIYADALTADEVAQLHQAGLAALARLAEPVPGDEPQLDYPPLAHWAFNERRSRPRLPGETSPEGSARKEGPARQAGPTEGRTKGVYAYAALLRGEHQLMATVGEGLEDGAALSFSAWVKPADLSGFREIVRRECPGRLLFSFQEGGTILSFGLNVAGYEECDAAVEPAVLTDGDWHHCAATFDGRTMTVYLDGKPAGALARPGRFTTDPAAPLFIGSSSGQGEHFQGALDDLRIYDVALSAEQVAYLHQHGRDALQRQLEAQRKELAEVLAAGQTLPQVLSGTRRSVAEKGVSLSAELLEAIAAQVRSQFPEDLKNFTAWTGAGVAEYLVAGDEFHRERVGRLVELLLEYKPLTEDQWRRQSAEDLKKWQEADALAARFQGLVEQGDAARYAPDWLQLVLDAGPRIQFRPQVSEAVAPYVTPATPETKDLTAEEARTALERDWLHQADQNPTPERITQEIAWARALAGRIAAGHPGKVDYAAELAQLGELEKQTAALSGPNRALYFQVRAVKRRIALKNPLVDFDKLLLVDMPFPAGSEWPHETRHRLGYMAVPGGRLLVLEGLSPAGHLRQLMPQPPLHGSFWRPDVSLDGQKIVFCFKPHNEKAFHLYEIGADGTGLVQLTDGIFDDLDPVYLPDGHIAFSTSRGHTYVRCMPPTNAYVLARCDADGKNIYFISANNEPDYLPSVMNDGRIVYTRWEYTDKPLWRAQGLWTVNPDGTQASTYWGNQSVWPDLLKDARAIPGSRRVMFTGSAHHNWFSGAVGIIDPDRGYNFPDGLTKVTAELPWPESGNGPVDPVESPQYHTAGQYAAYYSPYPLSEKDFLVSAQRGGKFVLYLMDVEGNRELIYEGVNNIFHAIPLKPRPRPPVVADRVAWPSRDDREKPQPGTIFSGNVYQGAPPELAGRARFLRVLSIDHKTYTYWHKRPYISTGPVVSIVQSEGVKRILGTVPIEPDGSVAFHAPAGIPLHFQLLDEHQRALQTMRSFVGLMPGERRGCLGCHESHSRTPVYEGKGLALTREPRAIASPPWGEDTVSYPRYVQPVLDRYCGACHQGAGEAVKTVDLSPKPGFLGFAEPYFLLTGRPSWGQPYARPQQEPPGFGIADMLVVEGYSTNDPEAYKTPRPLTKLSYRSRLIELCASGKHYDVKMDAESLQRLILWVDAMCPYQGDDEIRALADPEFQGIDWLSIRPRIQTAPRIVRPGPVD